MRISSQTSLSRKGKFSIRILQSSKHKPSQASEVCSRKEIRGIRKLPGSGHLLYWASLSRTTSFTSAFKWLVKHIKLFQSVGTVVALGVENGRRRTIQGK